MVSCICVTHKRVDFLKKSIQYFNKQTYSEKQLIILFEKDPFTKDYIEAHLHKYNFLKIKEYSKNGDTAFIIQPVNDNVKVLDQITEGEACYIRYSPKGQYVTVQNGIVELTDEPLETSVFTLHRSENSFFLKSFDNTFLAQDKYGNLYLQTTYLDSQLLLWKIVVLANNTFKIVHSTVFSQKTYFNHIGWELEVVNDIKSNITFCELNSEVYVSLGAKRNLTIHIASGQYICVWDDDDIYAENRIADQMRFLKFSKRDACSLNTEILIDNNSGDFYISAPRSEGWENSLLCKKTQMGYYDDLQRKEDTPVLYRLWEERKLCVMDNPGLYLYNIHANNISGNAHFSNIFKWSQKMSLDKVMELKAKFNLV